MKALQKKQAVPNSGTQKLSKNTKNIIPPKKINDADMINNMVFSEYEVWPILGELYKNQN